MRRELRYAAGGLRREHVLPLLGWSIPEALPSVFGGLAVARAVDTGFLAHRPLIGVGWLLALLAVSAVGAAGTRAIYRRLGLVVEPVRDDLVRRVVSGALRRGIAGRPDDGAIARLTHQIEVVRDTYAGQVMVIRTFLITTIGAVIGLLSLAPVIVLLIMPAFLVGLLAFVATLAMAVARQQDYLRCDEELSVVSGSVLAGARDILVGGTEPSAAEFVGRSIDAQAAAEVALARVSILRSLSFAVGGSGPLLILLAAAPWLISRGLSAGAVLGGLIYVQSGLRSALGTLINGLGGSGLRFIITLRRILDADEPMKPPAPTTPADHIRLRAVNFRYGPHADPVLRDLDLTVPAGGHLAVVGPSGVGKSTLASILCGLQTATGSVQVPSDRVLIPQEAFLFTGTVSENLSYLRPDAEDDTILHAAAAVGAADLITRLGGLSAVLEPARLSAGEGQLVALTRAYLSPADFAILDEATCHLDPRAERQAEEAFARRGGTLVVIAHRMSSALRARQILVLDGGRAIAGEHDALLLSSPLYRELLGHWSDPGSDPALLFGDADGLQPRPRPRLGDGPGHVVVHGARAEK
ncbi:ATP-binding cassette subfamily C protein [Allocatelliglobosispora scoriae]|uniref:ATP-binding cassette subfamily C protein n=1 Tax=Allocatelliglobosispora scoriae TaxID=643052 RepID=A0A841BLZ9_9ACTN|nr:ABC transporter ATP-binding protein [Allocatelliglobosispora scoriae]MBB5870107.1 ATP-binding cassette subfamily C protein [Allocatelliglobosispora scoriae]